MFEPQKIRADFSRSASRYGEHAGLQKRIGETLRDIALPYVEGHNTLLDVGAGSGEVTQLWPQQHKVALDVARGMCEQARRKNLQAVAAAAEALPFQAGSFGLVVSNVMLQWLARPQGFFEEAARVLSPGGYLCCTNFTHGTLQELDAAFMTVLGHSPVSPFIKHADMEEAVHKAGFEPVSMRGKTYLEPYESVDALLKSLRAIGATNKLSTRARGLLTPRRLDAVRNAYYQPEGAVQASWQVSFVIARKR